MERIKAGVTPPPYPPLDSRNSALPSRETKSAQLLPITLTEEFRMGNEGLFAAVRGELVGTYRQSPEDSPLHQPESITAVVIASSNSKKTDSIIQHIAHRPINIIRIPEAREWHTKDAVQDAASKAVDADLYIQNRMDEGDMRREVRTQNYITIANDQLNAVPEVVTDSLTHMPKVVFNRLGKPQREAADDPTSFVRSTFQHMVDLAEKYQWKSVPYLIELATFIYNPADPDHPAVSLQKSAVFLSVEGLKQLATNHFDEYVEKVKEQTGKTNGKTGVEDIAGGLEFAVLDNMGLVEFVSGSQNEIQTVCFPPSQRTDAKDHAYRLALGNVDEELITDFFGRTNQPLTSSKASE